MTHASLFTGIGGFDLAASWMGWENLFQVEIDPFCQQILKYHFPNAQRFTDIRQFDGKPFRGAIDVLSGGFPCQPYSTAGKRKGKEDERHLWPEMLRVIREVQPTWIVGENVRGLVSWNGGLVFEEVCADLEAEGYEVQPFILPAAGVGAPHRRDRVWFIAHTFSNGYERENGITEDRPAAFEGLIIEEKRKRVRNDFRGDAAKGATSHPCIKRLSRTSQGRQQSVREANGTPKGCSIDRAPSAVEQWEDFPAQSPVRSGNDGIPYRLDRTSVFEGVKDNRRKSTHARWGEESLKGYGNAVVPQVVLQIFKAIEQYEQWN